MLTVYLTRHGETVWNTESRMQGQQDSPLTPAGLQQAERLADELRTTPLDLAWSSPAPRALATAGRILAAQPGTVPLRIDDRVHEMKLGDWEGLTVGEASAADPENLQAFLYAPHKFRPVGSGETFRQVSDRMAGFLADLTAAAAACAQTGQTRNWLVVTHNITLKALFALMQERPLAMLRDGPPIRQAALYRAWLDNGWHIGAPGDLPENCDTIKSSNAE